MEYRPGSNPGAERLARSNRVAPTEDIESPNLDDHHPVVGTHNLPDGGVLTLTVDGISFFTYRAIEVDGIPGRRRDMVVQQMIKVKDDSAPDGAMGNFRWWPTGKNWCSRCCKLEVTNGCRERHPGDILDCTPREFF